MPEPNGRLANGKSWLPAIQFIGTIVLAGFAAYGGFQHAKGSWEQRVATLETRVDQFDKRLDGIATRGETQAQYNALKDALKDIQDNFRSFRNSR